MLGLVLVLHGAEVILREIAEDDALGMGDEPMPVIAVRVLADRLAGRPIDADGAVAATAVLRRTGKQELGRVGDLDHAALIAGAMDVSDHGGPEAGDLLLLEGRLADEDLGALGDFENCGHVSLSLKVERVIRPKI